jgi:hypothetical protein
VVQEYDESAERKEFGAYSCAGEGGR